MTDWEQHYEENHTPWDKGAPAPGLLLYLEQAPLTGKILVPGSGLGHDVRAIAEVGPTAEVVGLDVSPSAVERASQRPSVGKETYVEADLFQLPTPMVGAFDWIWEHTCFCAIDPSMRDAYVKAVKGALKPGGQFLGVFYLDPYDDEHRREDGRPPFGCSLDELTERFSPHFEITESWEPTAWYEGREHREWMLQMRPRG